jgi:cysteinyl-tRNA synthetase
VLDFNPSGIEDTGKAYSKLVEFKKEIYEMDSEEVSMDKLCRTEDDVMNALNDDFNTARAIGEIFKKINPLNEKIYSGTCSAEDIAEGKRLIGILENVLGIEVKSALDINEDKIEALIKERTEFRQQRNFSEADRVRDELDKMGIELKDTPTGTRWKQK